MVVKNAAVAKKHFRSTKKLQMKHEECEFKKGKKTVVELCHTICLPAICCTRFLAKPPASYKYSIFLDIIIVTINIF